MIAEQGLFPAGETVCPGELWRLLARQAELYTMGESTSLRQETVRELGQSVRFCLELALERRGLSAPPQGVSLETLFQEGQQAELRLTAQARELYLQVQATAPPVNNVFYWDTLSQLGRFFRRYDPYFFARTIPCSMDYPLCRPVEEPLQGVSFIHAYLRRLLTENQLCGAFPRQSLLQLGKLGRRLPLNLCEAVLTSALGLVLVGEDPSSLTVTDCHRAKLISSLGNFRSDQLRPALEEAGRFICRALGDPEGADGCLKAVTAALEPRLAASLKAGAVQGVFPGPSKLADM